MQDEMLSYQWKEDTRISDGIELEQSKKLIAGYKPEFRCYRSLMLMNEAKKVLNLISIGDGVVIACGESKQDFYLAQVSSLYDTGESDREMFATVIWYFKKEEIPKTKLPRRTFNNEVFLCTANAENVVDVETIINKCAIVHSESPVPMNGESEESVSTYFYRKIFNGIKVSNYKPTAENKTSRRKTNGQQERASTRLDKTQTKKADPVITKTPLKSTENTKENEDKHLTKNLVEKNLLTSPIRASGLGRLDASAAALDILDSGSESDLSVASSRNSTEQVLKRKSPPLVKSKVKTKLRNLEDAKKKVTPLRIDKSTMNIVPKKQLKVELKQLQSTTPTKNVANDNNGFNTRRSVRLSVKKQGKPNKIFKEPVKYDKNSGKASSTDNSDVENIEAVENKSKVRRSTRLSVPNSKSNPSRRKILDFEEDGDNSDEDVDFNAKIHHQSSSSSDGNNSEEELPKKTPRKGRKSVSLRKYNSVTPICIKLPKDRTPYIPRRKTAVKTAANAFDQARSRLHTSSIPDSLPCREEEFQKIFSFVEGKILSGTGGCMYISGVPGTGKTATVMEVVSALRQSVDDGDFEDFDYVDVNGMRLTEPHQIYVQILKKLQGLKATPNHAAQLLTQRFNQRGKKTVLLLVDELDLLWTKKQDVMYHLFDWPSHRHARLIVVAIANTMDLPERIMMSRVSSRLGLTRLSFLPYNFKQLQSIVSSRLSGIEAFDGDAVQLVARKVAAVSGDARRCLDVCRRAVEIASQQNRLKKAMKLTTIEHVHEALQEMFSSPMIMFIRNASTQEKMFLRSVVAEFRRSGLEEATIGQVLHHHNAITKLDGLQPVSVTSIIKVCNSLATARVLMLEMGRYDLYARLRLNVSIDDVLFALNSDV